jgi:uncharacterized protein YkwD
MLVHTPRNLLPLMLAALAAAVLALGAPAGAAAKSCPYSGLPSDQSTPDQMSTATLCLMNKERKARHRKPLRANAVLETGALQHTLDMITQFLFSHDGSDGSDPEARIKKLGYFRGADEWWVGENIAFGYGRDSSPRKIMDTLMASPEHRANILSKHFEEVGIAVEDGTPEKRGKGEGATYTQDFGTSR